MATQRLSDELESNAQGDLGEFLSNVVQAPEHMHAHLIRISLSTRFLLTVLGSLFGLPSVSYMFLTCVCVNTKHTRARVATTAYERPITYLKNQSTVS